jgi:hypothetical protein
MSFSLCTSLMQENMMKLPCPSGHGSSLFVQPITKNKLPVHLITEQPLTSSLDYQTD